jgi:hypothetical protein
MFEKETNSSVRLGFVPCAKPKEFSLNGPYFAKLCFVELLVEIAGGSKVLHRYLRRAIFNRKPLSVVGSRRAKGRVSVAESHSHGVTKRPHKASGAVGCVCGWPEFR